MVMVGSSPLLLITSFQRQKRPLPLPLITNNKITLLCLLLAILAIIYHSYPDIPSSFIMGNKAPSKPKEIRMLSEDIQEVSLLKQRPGCTGMFWRGDPTGQKKLASNNDWPRDGSKLRGKVVEVDGAKWLLATEVQQEGKGWVAAPAGAAMPFEYDNHYYLE